MLARLAAAAVLFWSGAAAAETSTLVTTQAEYLRAVRVAQPGDTIRLADGEWRDFQILFEGEGRPDRPITLTAQTPGRVILSGQSNLRLSGRQLVVSNLVFRGGWSPTGEVVSFRRSRDRRAVESRVTGVVIDGFNKPDRATSDNWVAMYGQDNRFDHNHLVGKTNLGTTLVVVRDATQGLENRHRIDHNYFGPRPNLGSNGGETLRVGTSADSLSASRTLVENNWFENCDGEVEIVSNKSGGNTYRGNVFFHSRGALVLRHGDGNLVENNVFIGGGKPHTGGVRIINRDQTVRNNYMEGLAGDGFAAALSVMYGVPDSPINRYHSVVGAVIENNTLINVRSVLLGVGMDSERSIAPRQTRFTNNLIVATADGADSVRGGGDLSGFAFSSNIQSPTASPTLGDGVTAREVRLVRNRAGLMAPDASVDAGADPGLSPVARTEVGVAWYSKDVATARLDSGSAVPVRPGEGTLAAAAEAAAPGDRLELAAGLYEVDRIISLETPLTVQGPAEGVAEITFSRPSLFQIEAGGSLKMSRVSVSGRSAPDEVGNALIRVRPGSNAANYELILEDSRIEGLTVNRGFDVVSTGKGSMAALIALRRMTISDVSGSVVAAAAETDDKGAYNAERVEIEGGVFRQVGGGAVDIYRGGTDESTFGPTLKVSGALFDHVGSPETAAVLMRGVQHAELRDNRLVDSGPVRFTHTVGDPVLLFSNNQLVRTPDLQSDLAAETAR